jgi:hypothetical protein
MMIQTESDKWQVFLSQTFDKNGERPKPLWTDYA